MITGDISSSIHGLAGRSGTFDSLMKVAAADLIVAAVLVFAALWFHRDGLRAGLAAGLGAVIALLAGAVIGAIWVEQRPFVTEHFTPLISHSADGSFPSDHLLALGGVAGGTWMTARRLSLLTTALAVVVAFARVFVGVHYAGDVVAGFAIGFACGLVTWLALGAATPLLASLDTRLRTWGLRTVRWGGAEGRAETATG